MPFLHRQCNARVEAEKLLAAGASGPPPRVEVRLTVHGGLDLRLALPPASGGHRRVPSAEALSHMAAQHRALAPSWSHLLAPQQGRAAPPSQQVRPGPPRCHCCQRCCRCHRRCTLHCNVTALESPPLKACHCLVCQLVSPCTFGVGTEPAAHVPCASSQLTNSHVHCLAQGSTSAAAARAAAAGPSARAVAAAAGAKAGAAPTAGSGHLMAPAVKGSDHSRSGPAALPPPVPGTSATLEAALAAAARRGPNGVAER